MCLSLMSWVQQVHNAAVVARSLGCQCDVAAPSARPFTSSKLIESVFCSERTELLVLPIYTVPLWGGEVIRPSVFGGPGGKYRG